MFDLVVDGTPVGTLGIWVAFERANSVLICVPNSLPLGNAKDTIQLEYSGAQARSPASLTKASRRDADTVF